MSDKSNKCEHYYDGLCMCNPILNDDGVLLGYEECNKISNRCIRLTGQLLQVKHAELRNKHDKEKLDSELQQLKAENEELQDSLGLANRYVNKYKQCLDDIEEIAKNGVKDDCDMPLDELSIILKIIKKVKESEE